MGLQLLCNDRLVDCPQVHAVLVAQNGHHVAPIEHAREQSHVVEIELEQVFAAVLHQRETGLAHCLHLERHARRNEIFKLIEVVVHAFALFALDVLGHNAFFAVLHVGRYHLVDAHDFQLARCSFFIFCRVIAVEVVYVGLDLPCLDDVMCGDVGVHCIGHAACEQIGAEKRHHLVVNALGQRGPVLPSLAQAVDKCRGHSVGPKKLLEVERIHVLAHNAAYGYRLRLLECNAQERAAGDIGEPPVLHEKLGQSEQVVVGLDLVDKHEGVFSLLQAVASHDTQ